MKTQTAVKKETSIEWLMTQLYKKRFIKEVDGNEPINLMNQAKEMEKEQIKDAHLVGLITSMEMEATKQAEEYYQENYGK